MVEFVSYDGEWPNLCRGTLIVRINGKEENLGHCLCTGGTTYFDSEWRDYVEKGPWTVDVPAQFEQYKEEITEVVNENVPYGCCGGCI